MKVPSQKRIYRDLDSGIISGVCAGVARYFDIDAVWVRAAAVAGLFIATPITLVAYIAAVILLPRLVCIGHRHYFGELFRQLSR